MVNKQLYCINPKHEDAPYHKLPCAACRIECGPRYVSDKGPTSLFLVRVESEMPDGFTAGCHVAVEADNVGEATRIAWDVEADAVGGEANTTVIACHVVPKECEAFVREVFMVTEGK